jgi:hypothetical protein
MLGVLRLASGTGSCVPAGRIPRPVRLCAERRTWPVLCRARRVGWEDPGPRPALCRAAHLAGVVSCSPCRLGGSWAPSGSVPSSAPGLCQDTHPASARRILGPVRLSGERRTWLVLCRARRVGWEDPGPRPALCRAAHLACVKTRIRRRLGGSWALSASLASGTPGWCWVMLPRRLGGSWALSASLASGTPGWCWVMLPRRLGGSWALSASLASSAPDAPDWRPGPRVGTSESGAQPPVGRAKNISHVLCFDVVSGVTSEEMRLANFYFRTFFRDLVASGHPWLPPPLPLPPPPLLSASPALNGSIPGLVRLPSTQCVEPMITRVIRVGWEDPGPCPPLCRAVRPTRRIGGRVRGWAPQNLARSPRSGALKYFPRDQNGLGLL